MPTRTPSGGSASDRAGPRVIAHRTLVGVAVLAAATLLVGCDGVDDEPPIPRASGPVIETTRGTATPYGTGAGQVWVLRPREGEIKSVVVYLHGYDAYLPFEWHLQWMDHLLENGSAVLFPRYQGGLGEGVDDAWVVLPLNLEDGLRTGFRALRYKGEPVVAAGFSVGATLAFVYAGRAGVWDVPAPRAVYSIYPVSPLLIDLGLDISNLDRTRALILAGDNDDVVGQDGAKLLLKLLTGLPPDLKELRVIGSSDALNATHDSPTIVERPITRKTFWEPLDEIVEQVRSG